MFTKTDKFRVISANPWIELGEVVESTKEINRIDYPHIFAPLYRFKDTKILLAEGDTVYRLVTKGWEEKVKAVKLSEHHFNNDIEIFVSHHGAEEKLKEKQQNRFKKYQNHDVYSALETIFLYTSQPLKDMSFDDIEKRFNYINTHSKEALEILKNK